MFLIFLPFQLSTVLLIMTGTTPIINIAVTVLPTATEEGDVRK